MGAPCHGQPVALLFSSARTLSSPVGMSLQVNKLLSMVSTSNTNGISPLTMPDGKENDGEQDPEKNPELFTPPRKVHRFFNPEYKWPTDEEAEAYVRFAFAAYHN